MLHYSFCRYYKQMYLNIRKIGIGLLFFLISLHPFGREVSISLKQDGEWIEFKEQSHIKFQRGRQGEQDILLAESEYTKTDKTELLLHLNTENLPLSDYYSIEEFNGWISQEITRFGTGSGYFRSGELVLTTHNESSFSPASVWGDFSIEFWLYPLTVSDGEQIFLWTGARYQNGAILPQHIKCSIQNNRLHWSFVNFFVPPDGTAADIVLEGNNEMIPKQWNHHIIRFNSATGLLEYCINNIPEDITYVTDTKHEGGTVFIPRIGQSSERKLSFFKNYTGFADEIRFSKDFIQEPNLKTYNFTRGYFITTPIDTGTEDSRIISFSSVEDTPSDTAIDYFFRISNQLPITSSWNHFEPDDRIGSEFNAGRFLEILVYLYPDGKKEVSPEVSYLQGTIEPDFPPPAPTGLTADPKDGSVTLSWNRVLDEDVKGYLIYYGTEPGRYFGSAGNLGPSPLDAGNTESLTIEGLENGQLYYFAVSAYDQTGKKRSRAPLSREVSARPLHDQ